MVSRWPRWPRRYPPRTCARVKAWNRLRRRLWCISFRSWALSRSSGLRPVCRALRLLHSQRRGEAQSHLRRRQFPCPEPIARPLLLHRAQLYRRLPPPQALGRLWLRRLIHPQPVAIFLLSSLAQVPSLVPARVLCHRGPTPSHLAQLPLQAWRSRAAAPGWRRHPLDRQLDVRAARVRRRRPANTLALCLAPMHSTPESRRGPGLSWRAAIPPVLPTMPCKLGPRHPRGACATSAPRHPRASPWTRIPGISTW